MSDSKVIIIAEAGVNHNGSIDLAKKLVDVAADAGCDYVKFQTFKTEKLVTESAVMANYQKTNTKEENKTQFEMLKELELSEEQFLELSKFCEKKQIKFLSTPFDIDSFEFLKNRFKLDFIKISSGDLTNAPYLWEIAKSGAKIVLSTGMADLKEIKEALSVISCGYLNIEISKDVNLEEFFKSEKSKHILNEKVVLLHCVTQYPTPPNEANLKALSTLKKEFPLSVGYSDHTLGLIAPLSAVSLGACLIEKHFTLDKSMSGPDHLASLDPVELKEMVTMIREQELMMGSGEITPSDAELSNRKVARKSIVAKKSIEKGQPFTHENLTTKRPEDGLSPLLYWNCLEEVAKRDFKKDEKIEL